METRYLPCRADAGWIAVPGSLSLAGVLSVSVAFATAACALLAAATIAAAQGKPLDADVKAVYLLNFGRFTAWPPGEGADHSSFPVCALGRDSFGSALDAAVSGERIDGKPVVARRIAKAEEAGSCRILFIGASEATRVRQILQAVAGARTLTVSDMPAFVEQGGMIQFVPEANRVRFTVNVPAAERAGRAFSSELLKVATSVKTGHKP